MIAPMLCLLPLAQAYAVTYQTELTMEDAKKIALVKEAGTIKSGELEHEKGRWIYSFDIVKGAQTLKVNIDANTGVVVEDSLDTPANKAKKAPDTKEASPKP